MAKMKHKFKPRPCNLLRKNIFFNHQQFHPQKSPFFVLMGDKILKIPEEFEEFPPPTKPTVLTRVCRGSVFRARLEDHPHPNPDFDQEIVGKHVCGGN